MAEQNHIEWSGTAPYEPALKEALAIKPKLSSFRRALHRIAKQVRFLRQDVLFWVFAYQLNAWSGMFRSKRR